MSENIIFNSVELSNGEKIAYRQSGNGYIPLLLIHGNLGSSLIWDTFMDNLPGNCRAYAIDLRGFGESTYNKPAATIKELAEDIKLFVDKLGLQNLVVCSWSAGGAVAMQFAVDHGEYVNRMILINSSSVKGYPVLKRNIFGKQLEGQYAKTRADMVTLLSTLNNAFRDKKMDTIKKIFDTEIFKIKKPDEFKYKAYMQEVTKQRNVVDFNYSLVNFNISKENNGVVDGTGEVDRLNMPILILQGDKDTLVTMEMAKEIREGIGENAELKVLNNCGHLPFVDDIDEVMNRVIEFL
jgi:2-hydroxy-6-oxonona-2,4-dienedioate hydrolase